MGTGGSKEIDRDRNADRGRLPPLRVLFVNHDYWPTLGGVEILTRNLARALGDRGHSVAIIADRSPGGQASTEVVEGIPVSRLPFGQALSNRDGPAIERLTAEVNAIKQEFRPDIVHVNFPAAGAYFHSQSLRAGEATVCLFHCSLDAWQHIWPLARNIAECADVLAVPSRFLAGNIGEVLSRGVERFRVMEHGVPESELLAI